MTSNTYNNLEEIVKILKERKLKISFVESCTGGHLASYVTCIEGSSSVISASFVTYDVKTKSAVTDVTEEMVEKYGVVSEQVALAMTHINILEEPDIVVSVTGNIGLTSNDDKEGTNIAWVGFKVNGKRYAVLRDLNDILGEKTGANSHRVFCKQALADFVFHELLSKVKES